MHVCIWLHGLRRSWHSCPRLLNTGNKHTPSMHNPQRRNVTTSMVGLKIKQNKNPMATYTKISPKLQRYSWEHRRRKSNLIPAEVAIPSSFRRNYKPKSSLCTMCSMAWTIMILMFMSLTGECQLQKYIQHALYVPKDRRRLTGGQMVIHWGFLTRMVYLKHDI